MSEADPGLSSDSDDKPKRGRPTSFVRDTIWRRGGKRNDADMLSWTMQLDPSLVAEIRNDSSVNSSSTLLAYVAHFDPEQQREALEIGRRRGARWLKRLIECQNRPPTRERMAESLLRWIEREYPGADRTLQIQALDAAAWALRIGGANTSESDDSAHPLGKGRGTDGRRPR